MTEEDHETELSPLSGDFTKDGITVEVMIFRPTGESVWILEVVYGDDIATIWEEPFETDQDAYDEFLRTVEREGMNTFLDDMSDTIH
ncbi:hypothetical protein [Pseudaminobacter soli (ex Li et al. 2025)]|uniref:Uncharacterized protein n=1 Tax=Pseudaminobacter soli (ex Li et al. 2025) TaxID=1295366 RepID=A0A2P7RJX9_9HYPH|nr:hypothetical protein [Mesorhizobium soli]PSJ50523.1 hypothetical protein C7I85_30035 [Mesorhizobium soli]